jgi:hypothetical protein
VALQKFLQYIKYIILESTPLHHSPLSLPSLILGIVSKGIIFSFTYMCAQYLYHIYPPTAFPHLFPLPLVPSYPDKTCSALLFFNFVKEK